MRRFYLAHACVDGHHNTEALQHLQARGGGPAEGGAGTLQERGAAWRRLSGRRRRPAHAPGLGPAPPPQELASEFPRSDAVVQLAALAHYNLQARRCAWTGGIEGRAAWPGGRAAWPVGRALELPLLLPEPELLLLL